MSLTTDIRHGVVGAIEEAYRLYGAEIMAYCRQHAPDVAEDIKQQVFLHATMHNHECVGHVRPWLFSIAEKTIESWGRDNLAGIIERCDDIERLLSQLTPAKEAAVRAIYIEDNTYEEAAEKLNITVDQLHERLDSAKQKLCA